MSKAEIFNRDGGACFYACGKILTLDDATTEHVVPTSHGGPKNTYNEVIACFPCNSLAGDLPLIDKIKIRDRNIEEHHDKSHGNLVTKITIGDVVIERSEVK